MTPLVILDSGDASLDVREASAIVADIGANMILLAGHHDAGKTTLLAELWAQFLRGPFAGFRFAGSKTLDAYDARHFGARYDSGNEIADTDRTDEAEMRFLHIRLADEQGQHSALLQTDIKGEVFEDLVHGIAKTDELIPGVKRVDRGLLLIDGERIADPAGRQTEIRDARLLIGALTEPAGVRADVPLLIVLSKSDLVDAEGRAWFLDKVKALQVLALERGFAEATSLLLAARPGLGKPLEGLEETLRWMCSPTSWVHPPNISVEPSSRIFIQPVESL